MRSAGLACQRALQDQPSRLRLVEQMMLAASDDASCSDDDAALGPWAHLDAKGRTQLNVSVATADGAAVAVLSRGECLPTCDELLLTTSAHGARSLRIVLVLGMRPMASACRVLGVLELPLPSSAERGMPQVSLSVCATAHQLHVVARDARGGACVSWSYREAEAEAATELAAAAPAASRPSVWRLDNCYSRSQPEGFWLASRWLALPHERGGMEKADDGEVDPGATAAKVWPCGFVLARHVTRSPHLAATLRDGAVDGGSGGSGSGGGAAVLELGAGCGLPGLACWAAGAAVCRLTDLSENLPRLDAIVAANLAAAASSSSSTCTDASTSASAASTTASTTASAGPAGPAAATSVSSDIATAAIDWTSPLPAQILSRRWDVVLAADCVFWPRLFTPLLATLETLVTRCGPTRVLMASTDRVGRGAAFAAEARAAGWRLHVLEADTGFAGTSVYELVLERGGVQ